MRSTVAMFGLLACSCRKAEPAPNVTPDPATSAVKPAATASTAPTSKRALAGYPPPLDTNAAGCRLTGAWEHGQPRSLRFRASAPPFATVPATKQAELTLLEGESPVAFIELSSNEVRVFGFVSEEIQLHAAKPFLMLGYVAPAVMTPLAWQGTREGKVGIALDVGTFLKVSAPVRAERACDDLTLGHAKFSARDAIPEATEKYGELPVKHRIPIRREISEKPVAELDPTGCSVFPADILQISGPDARVIVEPCSGDPSRGYAVVGWIPASLIKVSSTGTGGSWGSGGGVGMTAPRRKGKSVICVTEVPFVAEQSGERRLVGAIAPNVTIDVFEPEAGGFVEVASRRAGIVTADGVKLFAKESVLSECKPQ